MGLYNDKCEQVWNDNNKSNQNHQDLCTFIILLRYRLVFSSNHNISPSKLTVHNYFLLYFRYVKINGNNLLESTMMFVNCLAILQTPVDLSEKQDFSAIA